MDKTDFDELTLLLYFLIQNELPTAKVEQIVEDVKEISQGLSDGSQFFFGCKHLEAKAQEMADRIRAVGREDKKSEAPSPKEAKLTKKEMVGSISSIMGV